MEHNIIYGLELLAGLGICMNCPPQTWFIYLVSLFLCSDPGTKLRLSMMKGKMREARGTRFVMIQSVAQ